MKKAKQARKRTRKVVRRVSKATCRRVLRAAGIAGSRSPIRVGRERVQGSCGSRHLLSMPRTTVKAWPSRSRRSLPTSPDDVLAIRNLLMRHKERPRITARAKMRLRTRCRLARGRLPLQEPDAPQHLREGKIPSPGRTAQAAGLGQGNRPARRDPVRGPRCGRQGGHDQAVHGAPEPSWRACRGAGEAERGSAASGTSSVMSQHLPTPARSCCSTAAGTTAPASSVSWASARDAEYESSCARCRSSSATWCVAASI